MNKFLTAGNLGPKVPPNFHRRWNSLREGEAPAEPPLWAAWYDEKKSQAATDHEQRGFRIVFVSQCQFIYFYWFSMIQHLQSFTISNQYLTHLPFLKISCFSALILRLFKVFSNKQPWLPHGGSSGSMDGFSMAMSVSHNQMEIEIC